MLLNRSVLIMSQFNDNLPHSISKIIATLNNTELGYCDGKLRECEGYCATGVLLIEAKIVEPETIESCYQLTDLIGIEQAVPKIQNHYGIRFLKPFPKPLNCPLYFNCDHKFLNFEQVLIHINDEHNHEMTHRETANKLRLLSLIYDLENGVRKAN